MQSNLRKIRTQIDMTQAELAKELGVTPMCVSNYELCKRPLPVFSAKLILALAKQHGKKISLEEIYS